MLLFFILFVWWNINSFFVEILNGYGILMSVFEYGKIILFEIVKLNEICLDLIFVLFFIWMGEMWWMLEFSFVSLFNLIVLLNLKFCFGIWCSW